MGKKPIYKTLYFQVIVGLIIGAIFGSLWPSYGAEMKPLGDLFVKCIKMLIAPLVFVVLSVGIAQIGDLRRIGRAGAKAVIYFEIVTTLAMLIGIAAMYLTTPGAGMNVDPATLDPSSIKMYMTPGAMPTFFGVILGFIPNTFVGAFADGNSLQVLVLAVLFGVVLGNCGEAGSRTTALLNDFIVILFRVLNVIMHLAPIAAFGGIAFTVGRYGLTSLLSLGKMVAVVYLTNVVYIVLVLGGSCWFAGISLWKYIKYIRDEILIVFATCSTEPVFPQMMRKLEKIGCERSIIGLVLPAGYAFNLCGTVLYVAMAVLFISQAVNKPLSIQDLLLLLGVMTVTTKGVAGVAGIGFITLALTLSTLHGMLPVEGLALLIGVDRFMSEARALTSLIANGVAVLTVARWEGALDLTVARRELDRGPRLDDPVEEGLQAPADAIGSISATR